MAEGIGHAGIVRIYLNDLRLLLRAFRGRKGVGMIAVLLMTFVSLALVPVVILGGMNAADSIRGSEALLRAATLSLFSIPMMLSLLLFYPMVLMAPDRDRLLMTPIGERGLFLARSLTLLTLTGSPLLFIVLVFLGSFLFFGGAVVHGVAIFFLSMTCMALGSLSGMFIASVYGSGFVTPHARKLFRLVSLILMVALVLGLQLLFDAASRGSMDISWFPLTWAYDLLFPEVRGLVFGVVASALLPVFTVLIYLMCRRQWSAGPVFGDPSERPGRRERWMPWILPGSRNILLLKEIRFLMREPELLTRFVLITSIMVLFPAFSSLLRYSPPTPVPVYLTGIGWGASVVFTSNVFGMEGPRTGLLRMTPVRAEDLIASKIFLPLVLALIAGGCALLFYSFILGIDMHLLAYYVPFLVLVSLGAPFGGLVVSSFFPSATRGSRYRPSFSAVMGLMVLFTVVFGPGGALLSLPQGQVPFAPVAGVLITLFLVVVLVVVGRSIFMRSYNADPKWEWIE